MPHSHHSHSGQFCKHASGLLEDVVLTALSKGFVLYGLTEHVPRYRLDDLYPEEDGLSLDVLLKQFEDFLDEAHRLKTAYASRITLLVGLETEFITPTDLDHLDDLLKRTAGRVDYVVGSLHHVNSIPIDFDRTTFQNALFSFSVENQAQGLHAATDQMDSFLSAYFDSQYELFKRCQPEIIGHIDLCRLYDPLIQFKDYPSAWSKLERNVLFAIGYGALFEVNAAALKKGWKTAYPGEDVLELIIQHGGRFALSDDSHGPQSVGLNYNRMATYLRQMGVTEIWYLQQSLAPNAAGRHVSAVKTGGYWWEHQFWAEEWLRA
ncbi:hypothetical protein SERLA73DRAFT_105485 [Serpula lacrymans var. lacrymans S7.3]|uniref:Histidinol-phosphatase n=2 Tax=Serpula lacrymans var. lacrymans TaxID=341189 RepID=F8PTF4_SERL3|nr:uncharacterized protein SERLADRAFT_447775 [Serpula lacrymans var. lacrymans S7.9]EGO00982.1 hypothetical protein SERLA73DRAFT_105485 [Serpula lacrymans var. lacrymans S7.3]EGO26617.1 hypothetical protein SERLADRAFT_447775 [Serpula lacrymans var. lacrymans S7.9]